MINKIAIFIFLYLDYILIKHYIPFKKLIK